MEERNEHDDEGAAAASPAPETSAVPDAEAVPEPAPSEASADAEPDAAVAAEAPADAKPPKPAKRARKPRPKPRDPALARAFRARRPVDGKVAGVIKGGYEVRLGRTRAFCPHSQIDLQRIEDPEQMVGKTFPFRISQFRRGGEDIVVSRRALLEEDRLEEAKAVRAALLEGSVVQGRVSGIADFGAFVDLGAGVMGLVHISELSHSRIARVKDVVKAGDVVSVRILKLDEDGRRISLSMRQAQDDPWATVAESFRPGEVYPGTVLRLADFGAFVELAPDVQALAPAREFPPAPEGWRHGLAPGTGADWLVLSVDPAERRIAVAPAPADPAAARLELSPGERLKGRTQRVEKYGVFVWLAPGKVGLMPSALSGTPRSTDLARSFPIGQEVEVEVVEVADDGRRIRLAAPGQAERAAAAYDGPPRARGRRDRERRPREQAPPQSEPQGTFGTALADKLRAALSRSEG